MFFLTWNLQGNPDALLALLAFLDAERDDGVVVITEACPFGQPLPDRAEASSIEAELARQNHRYKVVVKAAGKGRTVVLASDSATRWSQERASERIVSAAFDRGTSPTLRVVGVHARSQLHASSALQRQHHAAPFVQSLYGEHLKGSNGFCVVLGDFNAQPYADEMVSTAFLGAARERRIIISRHEEAERQGREHHGLYNPSWRLLRDRPAMNGSFSGSFSGLLGRWWLPDQILFGGAVAAQWRRAWNPQVIKIPEVKGKPYHTDHRAIIARIGDKELT